jgi:hypothetical protein
LIRAAALGALAAGFVQNADATHGVSCDVTVTGQNNPDVDAAAVSAEVNSPALIGDVTVCLAGTFDFGPAPVGPPTSSVAIMGNPSVTSMRIVGLNSGFRNQATIRRGIQALTLSPTATLPNLTIENLRFEQPAMSAISILSSIERVRISGVHIAGVTTHAFTITVPPPPPPIPPPPQPIVITLSFRQGIAVTAALGDIDGEIEISDNVVNGGAYGLGDSALTVGSGIVIAGPLTLTQPTIFSAQVHVSNNRILNWAGTGIVVSGLVSEASIEENWIEPGAFARLVPGCTTPNADGAASGISLGGVGNSTVRDNVVNLVAAVTDTGTPAQCTAGLLVRGTAVGGASGNIFFGNRIRGTGTYAMVAGTPAPLPPPPPFPPVLPTIETNNLFAFNWVFGFTGTNATLFIGSGATANAFIGTFPEIEGNTAANWVINR